MRSNALEGVAGEIDHQRCSRGLYERFTSISAEAGAAEEWPGADMKDSFVDQIDIDVRFVEDDQVRADRIQEAPVARGVAPS